MKKYVCLAVILFLSVNSFAWRSVLYPNNWYPGYTISSNRFLHDFSYAGYHNGEAPIPNNPPGSIYDVTQSPYNADNTGSSDATSAIQSAIDDAGNAGGGIVYLPSGTYQVKPTGTAALEITKSGVVLRGDGTNQTYIYCSETNMRDQKVIYAHISDTWSIWTGPELSPKANITKDITNTKVIPVDDVSGFSVGNWIVVRADCTADFIAEHSMTGDWSSAEDGPTFYRQITDIDLGNKTLTIDIPLRYYVLTRDNARVYSIPPHLEEIGIEDLSIGNKENTMSGWGDTDYNTSGTGAYEVHNSHLIDFRDVVNGWIRRVNTYKPSGNAGDYHMLSNGYRLYQCRNITIEHCNVQKPKYEGGGGNGYGYILRGSDCLITDSVANDCRHNYDFKSMWTTGNVVHHSKAINGRYASDFHMYLSMANLFDNMTMDGNFLEGKYRPYGTSPNLHGHSTTQSVFWNTIGLNYPTSKSYIVYSQQFGWGYIIGTSGSASDISIPGGNNTEPIDFTEGIGSGDALEPQSLYLDQLNRRLGIDTNHSIIVTKIITNISYQGSSISQSPLPGYTIAYTVIASNSGNSNISKIRLYDKISQTYISNSFLSAGIHQFSVKSYPSFYYDSNDWTTTEPFWQNVTYVGIKETNFIVTEKKTYNFNETIFGIMAGSKISNCSYAIINDFVNVPTLSIVENVVTMGTQYGGSFSYIPDAELTSLPSDPLVFSFYVTNKGNIDTAYQIRAIKVNASTSIDDWGITLLNSENQSIAVSPVIPSYSAQQLTLSLAHNGVPKGGWIEFRLQGQIPNNTIATCYWGDDGLNYGGDIGKDWNGVRNVNPGYFYQQNNPLIRITYNNNIIEQDDGVTILNNLLLSPEDNVSIVVNLKAKTHIRVSIYDSSGILIKEFINSELQKGEYVYQWQYSFNNGVRIERGLYFAIIQLGKKKIIKNIIVR